MSTIIGNDGDITIHTTPLESPMRSVTTNQLAALRQSIAAGVARIGRTDGFLLYGPDGDGGAYYTDSQRPQVSHDTIVVHLREAWHWDLESMDDDDLAEALDLEIDDEPAPPPSTAAGALHRAACTVLGIDPGRGSKTRVAAALGVSPSQYSDAWGHRGSLETLTRWAGTLGLWTEVAPDGTVSFEARRPADV